MEKKEEEVVLTKEEREQVVVEAKDWSFTHGLVMGGATEEPGSIMHAPITLVPSPYNRSAYEQVVAAAQDFGYLVHFTSQDREFLLKNLRRAAKVDNYTRELLKIYETVNSPQKYEFAVLRSDYMLHYDEEHKTFVSKQVEINTMSSSFGGLSSKVNSLHRFLSNKRPLSRYPQLQGENHLPSNDPLTAIVSGIAKAWKFYNSPNAVVLMLVLPVERNAIDQRLIEYYLWEHHKIRLIRRTLHDISSRAKLSSPDQKLVIDEHEVAVVYMRASYSPDHFTGPSDWEARKTIEASLAIKCPSIAYHLTGTKKIQQVWCEEGVLERIFAKNKDKYKITQENINRLRRCFVGLYSLDTKLDEKIMSRVRENPRDFVLKPQREGGGNNIYDEKVRDSLEKMSEEELGAYILMERIKPKGFKTLALRAGVCAEIEAMSELGIFSVLVGKGEEIMVNENAGYLLRTKVTTENEGGVAVGISLLDSVRLV